MFCVAVLFDTTNIDVLIQDFNNRQNVTIFSQNIR